MFSDVLDIPLSCSPVLSNCLSWQEHSLTIACHGAARLLPLNKEKPGDHVRSFRLPSTFSRALYGSETEDSLSLAEVSSPEIVSIALSPPGLSNLGYSVASTLTSDHRVVIFVPTLAPDESEWTVSSDLSGNSYGDSSALDDVGRAQHPGATCMAWMSALAREHARWPRARLLVGNAAGQVLEYNINGTVRTLAGCQNISSSPIVMLKTAMWSSEDGFTLITLDRSGEITGFHMAIEWQAEEIKCCNVARRVRVQSSGCVSPSNLAITRHMDNDVLVVAKPGVVEITLISDHDYEAENNSQGRQLVALKHKLGFVNLVSGISIIPSGSDVLIYIFAHLGQTLVLRLDIRRMRLNIEKPLTEQITTFAKACLKRHMTMLTYDEGPLRLAFYGCAMSPCNSLMAISYSIEPVDRIQYRIPAHASSYIAICKIQSDPRSGAHELIEKFLHCPFATNIQTVLTMHRLMDIPVSGSLKQSEDGMATIQYNDAELLVDQLYRTPQLNIHRLHLASGELAAEEYSALVSILQANLTLRLLKYALKYDRPIGPLGCSMLLRYASFAAIFLGFDEVLRDTARQVFEKLQGQGINLTYELESLRSASKRAISDWPWRDICPACRAPVDLTATMTSGRCAKGHFWSRCSLTLALLEHPSVRSCMQCGRKAVPPMPTTTAEQSTAESLYSTLLETCDLCYYCAGHWCTKI